MLFFLHNLIINHSSYDELLNLDNSVSIQKLLPLKLPSNYNLRNQQEFAVKPIKTVH